MLSEAADLAQNRPLWWMMLTYGATQSRAACQKRWRRRTMSTCSTTKNSSSDICCFRHAILPLTRVNWIININICCFSFILAITGQLTPAEPQIPQLENCTTHSYIYNGWPIESRIWSIERCHFQWPWTTPTPGFKVTPFFDATYLRNGTRHIVSMEY